MTRLVKIPNALHPITIEPTRGRVVVRAGDTVIADTTNALSLRESTYPVVQYIPLADVNPDLIRPSEHETYCPFKGDATYYSIVTRSGEIPNAIWTYVQPYEAVGQIAGHVAFYANLDDITVEEAAA
jgi:uncharacterized protein (DUF427 family)